MILQRTARVSAALLAASTGVARISSIMAHTSTSAGDQTLSATDTRIRSRTTDSAWISLNDRVVTIALILTGADLDRLILVVVVDNTLLARVICSMISNYIKITDLQKAYGWTGSDDRRQADHRRDHHQTRTW